MSYNMISAFDYEIRNKVDLELDRLKKIDSIKDKDSDEYQKWAFFTTLKTYMLNRIEGWKAEIKTHEDKMLNGGR